MGRFFCWIGCSATRTILSKSANIVSESAKSESFGTFGKVISKNLLTFAVNDPCLLKNLIYLPIIKNINFMKTTIDYSQKENWCKFPEITKDVDTFYIFATEYILGSFEEGAPDYGSLDNKEMIEGMGVEYIGHATTYADDTNVFAPYYRQSGLKYAGKIVERDGNLDAALLGMPYNDRLLLRALQRGPPVHHRRTQPGLSIGQAGIVQILQGTPRLLPAYGSRLRDRLRGDEGRT